ncbi:MAG: hypothetical protein HA495_02990 [Thaumarchaeota archaeon]|nr:hypothetical protein [Nitrososphaerota archaeon]
MGFFLMEQLLKERSVIVIYVVFLIKAKVKKYLILLYESEEIRKEFESNKKADARMNL